MGLRCWRVASTQAVSTSSNVEDWTRADDDDNEMWTRKKEPRDEHYNAYCAFPSNGLRGQAGDAGSALFVYRRPKNPMTVEANIAHHNSSKSTAVRLFLCCRSRVLQSPLSPPNLRCHYTRQEGYSQNHCLTAEAHTGSCSRYPL